MKLWQPTLLTLAIAAAHPLPAAAGTNDELLKELRALRDRVTQLEEKLKSVEKAKAVTAPPAPVAVAPPPPPAPAGMTPDQARELSRLAVKVDSLEEAQESSFSKGMTINGSIDPTFIYNRAQNRAGFQLLNQVQIGPYAYDNSFFGTVTLDIQKELEGGTKFRLTLMPERGVGSQINFASIVHEASVSIPLAGDNTRLIAGQIPDWSGYELLPSKDNKLVTHNLLFDLIAPLAYTGVGLELTRGDWVIKSIVGNFNSTKREPNEKSPMLAYRGDYSINEYAGIGFSGVHGKAANLVNGTGDTGLNLFEVDGYYTRGDWTAQGQISYGQQAKAAIATKADGSLQTARWVGVSGLAAYKFTPRLEGVVRADYIYNRKNGGGLLGFGNDSLNGIGQGFVGYDIDGAPLAADSQRGANRYALSIGGNYTFNEYTIFKLEYRFDGATKRVFEYVDNGTFKKTNHLLGAQMVVSF
ncbi:MAG: hypothetical protein CFE40_07325 [Burkholderiales bacterium PBB1]|nr:MAG: hypothetical protein CFE40_07325 [Burkholderiales bacterium PBB1]